MQIVPFLIAVIGFMIGLGFLRRASRTGNIFLGVVAYVLAAVSFTAGIVYFADGIVYLFTVLL